MIENNYSEEIFILVFLIYGASWIAFVSWFTGRKEKTLAWANRFLWLGLVIHLVALVWRAVAADHAPWANQYESATFVAFGVIVLYLVFQKNHPTPFLGLFVVPAAMIAIGAASLLPEEYKKVAPLMPALQSYWLKIHVSLMLVSYGAFASTFALSLLYLVKAGAWTKKTNLVFFTCAGAGLTWFFLYVHSRTQSSDFWGWFSTLCSKFSIPTGVAGNGLALSLGALAGAMVGFLAGLSLSAWVKPEWAQRIPDAKTLDELNYRSVSIGFPLLSLGVILGAFWGHVAWGRYWAWDPKETWAFISWLIFAGFLHMRIFAGWNGRRLSWIGLIGAGSIVFTYWGVNFLLSGLHAYAKP